MGRSVFLSLGSVFFFLLAASCKITPLFFGPSPAGMVLGVKPGNLRCKRRFRKKFAATSAVVMGLLFLCPGWSHSAKINAIFEILVDTNTLIPDGDSKVKFDLLGKRPSIDNNGNVVFCGGKNQTTIPAQEGIYIYNSSLLSKVADRLTLLPGGGNTFRGFGGPNAGCSDKHSIDNGKVAFLAKIEVVPPTFSMFTNAGGPLVELPLASEKIKQDLALSSPWLEGEILAFQGRQTENKNEFAFPTVFQFDSISEIITLARDRSPLLGANYNPSLSGSSVSARLIEDLTSLARLLITNNNLDTNVAILGQTLIPGTSQFFDFVGNYSALDNNGNDIAFQGGIKFVTIPTQGVYKKIGTNSLERVADTNTLIPDGPLEPGGSTTFTSFPEDSVSLAVGAVAFLGLGGKSKGIYTDIDGTLKTVVDMNINKMITVRGNDFQIVDLSISPEGLSKTPNGHSLVFWADLVGISPGAVGGQAILRATVGNEINFPPPIDWLTPQNGEILPSLSEVLFSWEEEINPEGGKSQYFLCLREDDANFNEEVDCKEVKDGDDFPFPFGETVHAGIGLSGVALGLVIVLVTQGNKNKRRTGAFMVAGGLFLLACSGPSVGCSTNCPPATPVLTKVFVENNLDPGDLLFAKVISLSNAGFKTETEVRSFPIQ